MIQLTSGGIDSIAAHRLMPSRALYFRLGTESMGRELRTLDWAARQEWSSEITISHELEYLGRREADNGYVPYRNGLMVTFAAMRQPTVMVSQVAEWAPDKNYRYWRQLERTLTQAGSTQKFSRKVRIITPYAHMTKGELLRSYVETFGFEEAEELLRNTWSCYGSDPIHCGRCSGCQQRQVAEWVAYCSVTDYRARGVSLPSRTAMAKDALRWVRDNHSVTGLVKRAIEVRQYEQSFH